MQRFFQQRMGDVYRKGPMRPVKSPPPSRGAIASMGAGGKITVLITSVVWIAGDFVRITFDHDITKFNSPVWAGLKFKRASDPSYSSNVGMGQTGANQIEVEMPFDGTGLDFDCIVDAVPAAGSLEWGAYQIRLGQHFSIHGGA